jgi:hypothetical protein
MNPHRAEVMHLKLLEQKQSDLQRSGLNSKEIPQAVKKKLAMANVLFSKIRASCTANKKQKTRKAMTNIVGGEILSKYRGIRQLNRETGISRSSLRKAKSKVIELKARARLTLAREDLRRVAVDYMERDDISIQMPGKNDAKKHEGEKHQTRILNDYLSNIYDKFKTENIDTKISFSLFCKMRPNYILLTSLISRNTCLCSKHQNMAMKLKCLRSQDLQFC